MMQQDNVTEAASIRPCSPADHSSVLAIINIAAEAYRGVIPADRWHEPYMPAEELAAEIADGVSFFGYTVHDQMVGVMGVQKRHNVDLVRHAYVLPDWQGRGVGSMLLEHLCRHTGRSILIGTWSAAEWAIRFYRRHGFAPVSRDEVGALLRTYWNVPERQIASSVVLASPPLSSEAARRLMAEVPRPVSGV